MQRRQKVTEVMCQDSNEVFGNGSPGAVARARRRDSSDRLDRNRSVVERTPTRIVASRKLAVRFFHRSPGRSIISVGAR